MSRRSQWMPAGLLVALGCTDARREPVHAAAEPAITDAKVTEGAPVAPAPVVPDVVVLPPVPPPPPIPLLLVAGERGIIEIDLAGTELRTLSTTVSRSPRWLPGRTQVIFLGAQEGAFTDLRLLDLAGGSERSLAQLPDAAPCLPAAYTAAGLDVPQLALTNESELWIADKGKHACIVFADHEADLRDTERAMSVRLSDARLVERVYGAAEVCELADRERPKVCDAPPFDHEEIASPFEELGVESRSPDRRWLLILVRSELHDILHNEYVLYDTNTKKSYPLPRSGGTRWPKPVDIVKLAAKTPGWLDGLDDVAGSEAVTWVGDHHLVVGRTLFVAGEAIVRLPGDVAL